MTKLRYPSLKEKIHSDLLKGIWFLFGLDFDGFLVRMPKISMIIDDSSGLKIWSGTMGNYWYDFLTKRAHYGVYDVIVNCHSITVLFGNFRGIFSSYLLFRDVNAEHIKMLYKNSLGMERIDFHFTDFLKLY